MVFFRQTFAGTVQELQIYSNFPKRFIAFTLPAIFPIFSFLVSSTFISSFHFLILSNIGEVEEKNFRKEEVLLYIKIFDLFFLFPSFCLSISEMTRRRQTKIDRFIHVRCQTHIESAKANSGLGISNHCFYRLMVWANLLIWQKFSSPITSSCSLYKISWFFSKIFQRACLPRLWELFFS